MLRTNLIRIRYLTVETPWNKSAPGLPLLPLHFPPGLSALGQLLQSPRLSPDSTRIRHPKCRDEGSDEHPSREDEKNPAEPGGFVIIVRRGWVRGRTDAAKLGVGKKDLGEDGAKFPCGGGEAVCGAAVFSGKDFCG